MTIQESIDDRKRKCRDHIAEILPLIGDLPDDKLDEAEIALEIAVDIARRKKEEIQGKEPSP